MCQTQSLQQSCLVVVADAAAVAVVVSLLLVNELAQRQPSAINLYMHVLFPGKLEWSLGKGMRRSRK